MHGLNEHSEASQTETYDMRRVIAMSKVREVLIASKAPVFAVLDGAKFSDLPSALLRARLLNRPLYSDRGGQIRDFDQTAPQMVYLDRIRDSDPNAEDRPCSPHVIREVFDLIEGNCSSVVFWSCGQGGNALFRHLRKINRVQIAAGHLPSVGDQPIEKHKDDILLFRHADANVMAQVVPALSPDILRRLLGPAEAIRFVPDVIWSLNEEYEYLSPQPAPSAPIAGMLRFDGVVMKNIEARRAVGVLRHLLVEFSHYQDRMGDAYKHIVTSAYRRAASYGLETLEEFETFILTECEHGPRFELRPEHQEAHYMLVQSTKSPAERVYYARRACLDAAQASTY